MANPRQRRKTRSGTHRVVRHSNHAKKNLKKQPAIRGPKLLQEAWDKHKTVRQNYEAIGLVASLTPTSSGGVERTLGVASSAEPRADVESTAVGSSSRAADASVLARGFGRIVRDASGNVVEVQLAEEDEEATEGVIEEGADPSQQQGLAAWVGVAGSSRAGNCLVVERIADDRDGLDLEELAQTRGGPVPRHSSRGELGVLRQLVATHQEDVQGMARDRRLNAGQRTAGQLSRAIAKAGGFAALVGTGW